MPQIALVVDDSRVARMTLNKLLVAHNLEVVELGSGEEALLYLQSENVKPDIIFMDVMMGGMDGLIATQQIKADDTLKHIPVVMCTGHDTDADRAKSQEVGALATITKPPEAEALDDIIAELARYAAEVPQENVASSVIDTTQLLAELSALVKQNLLPTMQQELRELTATVSRQVAHDTAERHIAEQMAILNNNSTAPETLLDEEALQAKIINTIEHGLLPNIQQKSSELAENISRQIATDTAGKVVAEQLKLTLDDLLPALKNELLIQTQQATADLANSAEKVLQNVIKQADLSTQIRTLLNTEGRDWLQDREQQMFEPLMQQVEVKIAPLIMSHLNEHLTSMIAPIARTIVEEKLAGKTAYAADMDASDNNNIELGKLSQQVSVLKMVVMGLGGIVLVLAVAMIF